MVTKEGWIYLVCTREFLNSKKPVYKIGRTQQETIDRFKASQYKDCKVYIQVLCDDCFMAENHLLKLFKVKYLHRKEYGNEWFEGSYTDMIRDICQFVNFDLPEILLNKKRNEDVIMTDVFVITID